MLYFREAALIIVDLCTRGTAVSHNTRAYTYTFEYTRSHLENPLFRE